MENKTIISVINWFLFLTIPCLLIIIFISGWNSFHEVNPNDTPQIIFLDEDLYSIYWISEGFAKLWTTIFGIIAMLMFGYFSIILFKIKKAKNNNFIATIVFFSVVYVTIARLFENLYVPFMSDIPGLIDTAAQFYIPFDIMGLAFIMIFSVQVFLAEELKRSEFWSYFTLFLSILAGLVGLIGTLGTWTGFYDSDITMVVSIILVGISILMAFNITIRIFKIRNRVTEQKDALSAIGFFYTLLLIGVILLIVSLAVKSYSHTISYEIRAIKNLLYIIAGYFFYKGIIRPSQKH